MEHAYIYESGKQKSVRAYRQAWSPRTHKNLGRCSILKLFFLCVCVGGGGGLSIRKNQSL